MKIESVIFAAAGAGLILYVLKRQPNSINAAAAIYAANVPPSQQIVNAIDQSLNESTTLAQIGGAQGVPANVNPPFGSVQSQIYDSMSMTPGM